MSLIRTVLGLQTRRVDGVAPIGRLLLQSPIKAVITAIVSGLLLLGNLVLFFMEPSLDILFNYIILAIVFFFTVSTYGAVIIYSKINIH